MMKKVLLICLLTIITINCKTTNPEVKTEPAVVEDNTPLVWHTDMTKATDLAMKKEKPLFLFFTGSDWCGWCIRLQKEVFKTPEFEKWAKENVILVELDFPRKTPQEEALKTQNRQLQQTLQVRGYPTIWFVKPEKTAEGKINLNALGSSGYMAGGPEVWIANANTIIKKK